MQRSLIFYHIFKEGGLWKRWHHHFGILYTKKEPFFRATFVLVYWFELHLPYRPFRPRINGINWSYLFLGKDRGPYITEYWYFLFKLTLSMVQTSRNRSLSADNFYLTAICRVSIFLIKISHFRPNLIKTFRQNLYFDR